MEREGRVAAMLHGILIICNWVVLFINDVKNLENALTFVQLGIILVGIIQLIVMISKN